MTSRKEPSCYLCGDETPLNGWFCRSDDTKLCCACITGIQDDLGGPKQFFGYRRVWREGRWIYQYVSPLEQLAECAE